MRGLGVVVVAYGPFFRGLEIARAGEDGYFQIDLFRVLQCSGARVRCRLPLRAALRCVTLGSGT
jgi:hypothetical protein